MDKGTLVCFFALAIVLAGAKSLLGEERLPPELEAEEQAFMGSSMPQLALKAAEIQHNQLLPRTIQSSSPFPSDSLGLSAMSPRLKAPRKLVSLVPMKTENDISLPPENPSAIPRALRAKAHHRQSKAHKHKAHKLKAHKHKAHRAHKKGRRHRKLKSKSLKSASKRKHRALIASITKAIESRQARRQAQSAAHKTPAQIKVENKLLQKILLGMDAKTANKLIKEQMNKLPGKHVPLNRRKLLQVLKGSRKLNMANDAFQTIKDNLLLISAGLAIGGHLYRRRIDYRHDQLLRRLNQMRGTLSLKVGLMNESMDLLDRINNQMKAETSRLLIEDEMYDKRFQNKIDRIKNIPI